MKCMQILVHNMFKFPNVVVYCNDIYAENHKKLFKCSDMFGETHICFGLVGPSSRRSEAASGTTGDLAGAEATC